MLTFDVDATDEPLARSPGAAVGRPPHWQVDLADRLANDPPERWAERLARHASFLEQDAPEAAMVMRVCAAFIQGSPTHTAADLRSAAEMVRRQAIDDCTQVAAAFTSCGARLEAQGALTVARHLASIPLPAFPGLLKPAFAPAEPDGPATVGTGEDDVGDAWEADEDEDDDGSSAATGSADSETEELESMETLLPEPSTNSRPAQRPSPTSAAALPAVTEEEQALLAEISRVRAVMSGRPLPPLAAGAPGAGAAIPLDVVNELDAVPVFHDGDEDEEVAFSETSTHASRVLADILEILGRLSFYAR